LKLLSFALSLVSLAALAHAHVGSPDIFLEGKAGPYQLFVTVRPPLTIPGVAEIEVRSESPGVLNIKAVPLAITGVGSKLAPIPDSLKVSPRDPQFFTGALWLMTAGSWQARLTVQGAQGEGTLSIPIPSVARASKRMTWGLGLVLSVVGIFLMTGLIAIIGAASREAKLDPGQLPSHANLRSGRKATLIGALIVLAVVSGGNAWWNAEARDYDQRIYKPLKMAASLNGSNLLLQMSEPGWMQAITLQQVAYRVFTRKMDDLVPDHGHIMHLYVIRQPGLDVVYHLHPEQRENGSFVLPLPSMPAGHYKLYADIVHADGFPETMVTEIDLPTVTSRPLAGDDASVSTQPWQQSSSTNSLFTLPDGYKMEWLRGNKPLRANEAMSFNFRLGTLRVWVVTCMRCSTRFRRPFRGFSGPIRPQWRVWEPPLTFFRVETCGRRGFPSVRTPVSSNCGLRRRAFQRPEHAVALQSQFARCFFVFLGFGVRLRPCRRRVRGLLGSACRERRARWR
jgi:hypothetical protein